MKSRRRIMTVTLMVLMAGIVLLTPLMYNCEGCCGPRPTGGTELQEWYSCMKACEDAAKSGVIYSCAETSQEESIAVSVLDIGIPTASAQVSSDDPCVVFSDTCRNYGGSVYEGCKQGGGSPEQCSDEYLYAYHTCLYNHGCGKQRPRKPQPRPE